MGEEQKDQISLLNYFKTLKSQLNWTYQRHFSFK